MSNPSGPPGTTSTDERQSRGIPLFDERFRWVLRRALAPLRELPGVDLDEPEQMAAAYGILSHLVQQAIQERRLTGKLDAATVAAVAADEVLISTAGRVLLSWLHDAQDLEGGSG
jgi:hypothetical protein